MRCLKLTLAYHGANYVGWQVQSKGTSVQQVLEEAWKKVTGETIRITASGRTDSGVHALAQVCSLQTRSELKCESLVKALNAHTPTDVCVLRIEPAPVNFHAIRDAKAKTYRYTIQHAGPASVFHQDRCWWLRQRLRIDLMQRAASFLIGRYDFASFQAAGSDRASTVRSISELEIEPSTIDDWEFLDIRVTADGFLYNMVRNIVGTLVDVGLEKCPPEDMQAILAKRDRRAAGITAPARGLCLIAVSYD